MQHNGLFAKGALAWYRALLVLCDLFDCIAFPLDGFFPPERCGFLENGKAAASVSQKPDDDDDCGRAKVQACNVNPYSGGILSVRIKMIS